MKRKIYFLIPLAALLAFLSLTACTSAPVYAAGTEKDQAVAAVTPFTQDILNGLQKNDYGLFSKDFNPNMVKNFPQDSFTKMVSYFADYGAFVSSELTSVQIVDPYYQVNYKVTFAKKVLTMGVLIPKTGTAVVSGLWFE